MNADAKDFRLPLMVRGDIDGFIGLFIDNLVNLLLITGLCLSLGMGADLVFGRILPGTALSVLAVPDQDLGARVAPRDDDAGHKS